MYFLAVGFCWPNPGLMCQPCMHVQSLHKEPCQLKLNVVACQAGIMLLHLCV
jgi:hypothetical protein